MFLHYPKIPVLYSIAIDNYNYAYEFDYVNLEELDI